MIEADLLKYMQQLERAIRGAYEAALDDDVAKVLEILEKYSFDHPPIPRGSLDGAQDERG